MLTSTDPPPSLRSLTPASAEAVAGVHLTAREAYYSVQPDPSGAPAQAEAYARMWHSRLGREDWQLTGASSGRDLVGFTAVQLPAVQVLAGHDRAELEVWSLNHRAREFYVRRGWEIDGRRKPAHAGTRYLGMVLRSPVGP
ncbi:hypothetical protein [Cryobacterium sp. AP23]